jgi:hypothetical protein
MKLLLPQKIIERLRSEVRGRSREIGGVLVGEHLEGETFRIVDLSIQVSGGTAAHFIRDDIQAWAFLRDFFRRTGHDYHRFNYIGEWHSHPSFMPLPSGEDRTTMFELLDDPDAGVNFAVLMIVRLRLWSGLQLSATLFRRGLAPAGVDVEVEDMETRRARSIVQCILDWFR